MIYLMAVFCRRQRGNPPLCTPPWLSVARSSRIGDKCWSRGLFLASFLFKTSFGTKVTSLAQKWLCQKNSPQTQHLCGFRSFWHMEQKLGVILLAASGSPPNFCPLSQKLQATTGECIKKRTLKTVSSYCSSMNFMISFGVQPIILHSFSTVDVEIWQCRFMLYIVLPAIPF